VPIRLKLAGANEYYPAATQMTNMQTAAMRERDAAIQQRMDSNKGNFN
jgi:hypothetical protein